MLMPVDETRDLKTHALELAQQEWGGCIVGSRLKPLGPSMSDLVSEPDVTCLVGGSWFAVSTEPKEERHVQCGLASVGMVPYLPIELKQERHGRGQTRTVERPMITGYLFVKCQATPAAWHTIMATRGVRRVLGSKATGMPIIVPEGAIEVIRAAEADDLALVEQLRRAKTYGRSGLVWHFSRGDQIRIKNGPFAGFYAELLSAVDPHDRIRAILSVFGRANVTELSAHDIEAI